MALIQETKLGGRDGTPNIRGYTVPQSERTGKEVEPPSPELVVSVCTLRSCHSGKRTHTTKGS